MTPEERFQNLADQVDDIGHEMAPALLDELTVSARRRPISSPGSSRSSCLLLRNAQPAVPCA